MTHHASAAAGTSAGAGINGSRIGCAPPPSARCQQVGPYPSRVLVPAHGAYVVYEKPLAGSLIRSSSARSSAVGSHDPARTLASICSGFVAPEITLATAG